METEINLYKVLRYSLNYSVEANGLRPTIKIKLFSVNNIAARRWWYMTVIPALWEPEAGGFLSLEPAWFAE